MNKLLCCFDENKNENKNLNLLLSNYQEYFVFEKKNNKIYLYLSVNNLKNYLMNGIEIKYKKFIFLFLENISTIKNNINYKWDYNLKNILINKYLTILSSSYYLRYLDKNDYLHLQNIFNLNIRYLERKM